MTEGKLYELITVGVVLCGILVILFVTICIIAIGIKNRHIAKEAKAEERFNELAKQNNEIQKLFKEDVKKIMDGFKQIINK